MGDAKTIRVAPISASDAKAIVLRNHYSGKVVPNSQLHFGVFVGDRCGGAMSFGPSMDKRRMAGLVSGTPLTGFLELNRMAFSDWLPRNSESRAIGVAMRLIRKTYPWIEWVVSFSDGCQCGDGTIYRASGFVLTQIKRNTTQLRMPDGTVVAKKTLDCHHGEGGRYMSSIAIENGARPLPGFQFRYVYFLKPEARNRLAVPILPFSDIEKCGAGMYRGKPRAASADSGTPGIQPGRGGANPTAALLTEGGAHV